MNYSFIRLIPKDYFNSFLLLIFLLFFSSMIEIIGIGLIPIFISFIIDPNILLSKLDVSFLRNYLNNNDNFNIALVGSLIICFTFIFKNIFISFCIYYEANFIKNLKLFNSKKIFEYYIFNPYKFHLDKNPSTIVRSVTTDVEQSVNYLKNVSLLVKESLILILLICLLFLSDPKITMGIFLVLSFFSFVFFFLIKNNLTKRGKINFEFNSNLIKIINQSFNAIKDVKLFSKEKYLVDLHQKNYLVLQKNYLMSFFLTSLPRLFLEVLAVISIISIIMYLYIRDGNILNSIPLITLMTISAIRLIPSFNSITKSMSSMKYNLTSLNSIIKILKDSNNVNIERIKKFTYEKQSLDFKKNIYLKNISFRYNENSENIIEDINLEIKKNSKIAIVGKSGSGKTTIVDIIIGLLKPYSGEILIDGISNPKKKFDLNIGYIPQNFYLFDDSIKNNVAFGIPENLIDMEKVIRALKFAKLDEFVSNLENKYETRVGNQGIMLSGGQKQRVIIARAAYYDPDILVLDEATSAIDEEVEKEFIDNLISLSNEKTLIIISHRRSTIENCEDIYKLDNKKLIKIK